MKSYIFRVELEEEDGTWSAVIPAMPGCAVDAGSPEEAMEAIRDLAQVFVESLLEDGKPIPLEEVSSGAEGAAVAVIT